MELIVPILIWYVCMSKDNVGNELYNFYINLCMVGLLRVSRIFGGLSFTRGYCKTDAYLSVIVTTLTSGN